MAARKTSALPTRIWKFTARFASREDERLAFDLLRTSRRYYNRLVEIERQRVADFGAIRRRHAPELAAADDAWSELDQQIEFIYREAKGARKEHFEANDGEKRRVLPAEYQARVDAIKRDQKAVSAAAKVHRADFAALLTPAQEEQRRRSTERANGGGPRIKSHANADTLAEMLVEDAWSPAWKEIAKTDAIAHAALLRARNECSLPSGTYLGVEEAFGRAKTDSSPRPPSFRRFTGEGRLQVQLRDVEWSGIVAGLPACSVRPVVPDPNRKGDQSRMMVMRLNQSIPRGAEQAITLTTKMHRSIPADAAVKWAAIMVRKVGNRHVVEVQFTLEHASFAEAKRPAGERAPEHIKIGWAGVDGGVRIAHWPGGDVVVPTAILDQHDHANAIGAASDRHWNTAKKLLRRIMRHGPHRLTAWHRMLSDRARQMMREACDGYARYVLGDGAKSLWVEWVQDRKSRGEDLYCMPRLMQAWLARRLIVTVEARLAFWCLAWAKKDAHLCQFAIESERRFGHRRDAFMRTTAIRIATEFSSITVDDYNIAALKKLDPLTMPGEMVRDRAQAQLHSAAPGRFREILREVMGPRCVPCERSGDAQTAGVARSTGKQARKRGGKVGVVTDGAAPDGASRGAVANAAE